MATMRSQAKNGKLAPPGAMKPITLVGQRPEDILLPTLHIFHDVGNEAKERGEHNKGTALDSLTNEEVAVAPKPFRDYPLPWCVPITAYAEYVAWTDERGDRPLYVTQDREWIEANHPEDLEWGSGRNGKGYRAQRYLNFVVLFDGRPDPIVLQFSKQALRQGQIIATTETRRRMGVKSVGCYQVWVCEKSNDLGTWFQFGKVDVCDPRKDMMEAAQPWVDMIDVSRVKTREHDGDTPF